MSGGGSERVLTDVWDRQTRILHWINALLIITLALLMIGKAGMEFLGVERSLRLPVKRLHAYIGYVFVFTFSLRVFWGFMGNTYARWTDMIPHRKEHLRAIWRNLRWYLSGFKGSPARAVGHDPSAAVFYAALFLILLSQSVTGLILSGTEFKMYPAFFFMKSMSVSARQSFGNPLGDAHEFGFWFIILFLAAHLTGLVVHEVKEKTGLLSSMIHGKKYFPKDGGR